MSQSDSINLSPGNWNNPNFASISVSETLSVNNIVYTGNSPGFVSSEEVLLTGNFTGAINTPYTCRLTKFKSNVSGVGNLISLHLPAIVLSADASEVISFDQPIPVSYLPINAVGLTQFIQVDDNNTLLLGTFNIENSVFNISVGAGQNPFSGSGGTGLGQDQYISWSTSSNL